MFHNNTENNSQNWIPAEINKIARFLLRKNPWNQKQKVVPGQDVVTEMVKQPTEYVLAVVSGKWNGALLTSVMLISHNYHSLFIITFSNWLWWHLSVYVVTFESCEDQK